jgi:hypothetical protein
MAAALSEPARLLSHYLRNVPEWVSLLNSTWVGREQSVRNAAEERRCQPIDRFAG